MPKKKKKVARKKPRKRTVASSRRSRSKRGLRRTSAGPTRRPRPKKKVAKKARAAKRRPAPKRTKTRSRGKALRPARLSDAERSPWSRGVGPESGGQSGDTEGLTRAEVADSESVEELVEEGQAFEAGIVDAVENAPDADESEIRTREVPEDDVPEEYRDED